MTVIGLSDEDIREAGRLGKCLDSQLIPVTDIRNFLTGLQRKIQAATDGGPKETRARRKSARKISYRIKIVTRAHGNKRQPS